MRETDSVVAAYERGRIEFMGIELLVAPGTLVPRAETELLARTAIEALAASRVLAARVVDMCCGAGNLACAIAHHVPTSRVWASDLADACVALARKNVAEHALAARVSVHQGDLFESLRDLRLQGTIDVIVCNPPYISDKRLAAERAELLELEPREAFAAGPYGLSLHQRVIKHAPEYLRPGGVLLAEVGRGQDRQVELLFQRSKAYEDIRTIRNAAGEGRVVLGHRRDGPIEFEGERS